MDTNHFEALFPADSREKEVGQIVSYLRQGTSCQLIGLPGVGRSNILQMLVHNRQVRTKHFGEYQVWIHFVYMNFAEVRGREFKDVMKYIFLSLADSLRDRNMDEAYAKVTELFRSSLMLNDEFVLYQGLKQAIEYLSLEKKLTIVFLFDRFEEYLPSVTGEFFSCLRVLRDRAKFRFAAVFSVTRPLEDTLEEELISDYYDYIVSHHIYVDFFDAISSHFRLDYLQEVTGKSLPQVVIDEVARLTGRQGRLLKLAFESLFLPSSSYSHFTKDTLITPSELSSIAPFLQAQKSLHKALESIWHVLTPSEQQYLQNKQYRMHTPESEYLEHIGLVANGTLTIPLLESYIEQVLQKTPHGFTAIIYDMYTNTIRKGELILSDKLTAAEFRLMKYLLERPEMIVEREEIIRTVWQENKTISGVTDQALDQLIFRLRKKIEIDPNEPIHIVTVKGRGFKFSP